MLKFKLGNGKTIKANFAVLVVGKSQEGRERAVDWLCNHLVIEPGKELKKRTTTSTSLDSGYLLWDSTNETSEGIILSGPEYGSWTTPYPDVVFKVSYIRDVKRYVITTEKPDLGFGYLI